MSEGTIDFKLAKNKWNTWKRSLAGKAVVGKASEFSDNATAPLGLNWRLFDEIAKFNTEAASSMLLYGLQAFMSSYDYKVQEYTTSGDFPDEVMDLISKYHTGGEGVDDAWRNMFVIRDYTNTTQSSFSVMDISSGLTFRKVQSGDKIDVYEFKGTGASVSFEPFGGAIGWNRVWFEDQDYIKIAEVALHFRNKYHNDMAKAHYTLIDALSSAIDQAWVSSPGQVPHSDPFYEVVRDIKTINTACSAIITTLEAKDVDIDLEETFIILAPMELKQRIGSALATNYRMPGGGSPIHTNYNAMPYYTKMLNATDVYYIILPKRKIVTGIRKRLEMQGHFDIMSYSEVTAGWGRFGAVIGDKDQFKRCSTSGGIDTKDGEPQFIQALEYDGSGNTIYIGEADPGTTKAQALWRIRKLTYDGSGNVLDVQWASASHDFDKTWNDRATYIYS